VPNKSVALFASGVVIAAIGYNAWNNEQERKEEQREKQKLLAPVVINEDFSIEVIHEQTTIVHFAQWHWSDKLELNPGSHELAIIAEMVARSQFKLAKFILANPDFEVFSEELCKDLTFESLKNSASDFDVDSIFSNGIPNEYSEIKDLQKQCLAKLGASRVLFYLGYLKNVHKVIECKKIIKIRQDYEMLLKESNGIETPHIKYLIHTKREAALAKEVNSFLESNPGKKILIVFGAGHELSGLFENKSFQRIGSD
jgi:hypothetical protein